MHSPALFHLSSCCGGDVGASVTADHVTAHELLQLSRPMLTRMVCSSSHVPMPNLAPSVASGTPFSFRASSVLRRLGWYASVNVISIHDWLPLTRSLGPLLRLHGVQERLVDAGPEAVDATIVDCPPRRLRHQCFTLALWELMLCKRKARTTCDCFSAALGCLPALEKAQGRLLSHRLDYGLQPFYKHPLCHHSSDTARCH